VEAIESSDVVRSSEDKAMKMVEAKVVGVVRMEAVDCWQWQKAVSLK